MATSVGVPCTYHPGSLPPSPSTPAVLLIGRNPGLQEDRAGLPFVGPSGRLVQSVYCAGIHLQSLASIYFVNTARCFHRDGANAPRRCYSLCSPYLLADISAILSSSLPPLRVLTLGAEAATHFYALCGHPKVNLTSAFSRQLSRLSVPLPSGPVPVTVFSTFHPAYVLRDHNMIHAVRDHLDLLRLSLLGREPSATSPEFIAPCSPRKLSTVWNPSPSQTSPLPSPSDA